MPTYVYKFLDTNETIEVQQSFSDDALTEAVHPVSGKKMPVKKVFLPVGVTFKGDGFYKTDSRSSTKKAASSSTSEAGSTTSDSPSGGGSSSSTEASKAPASPAPSSAASSD